MLKVPPKELLPFSTTLPAPCLKTWLEPASAPAVKVRLDATSQIWLPLTARLAMVRSRAAVDMSRPRGPRVMALEALPMSIRVEPLVTCRPERLIGAATGSVPDWA